jgi:DNA-binding transcriptional ArsR family regulator
MHAFEVLADPVRRRLLELLAEGERSSGDMTAIVQTEFGLTQSAVSQHLKILRDNEFAAVRIDGSRRIYAIQGTALREVDGWLDRFRMFWAPKLEALATEVARGKRERKRASKVPGVAPSASRRQSRGGA